MLLFAHLGVTLGATVIAVGVRERFKTERLNDAHEDLGNKSGATDRFRAVYRAIGFWFESLGRLVDIRAIFIGSLLPDIIDKPIGHWLLADSLNNGRIFSHSFLFFLVTLIVGLFLYRLYTSTFVLAVSFGVMMHLILDSMWLDTHTLLWPFLGVTFEQGLPTDDNFIVVLLRSLRQMPYLLFEIVGFLIVCAFGFWLVKKGVIIRFIRSGKVNQSM